jgi:ABC-type nitrate/sulfonate/bicarbonate transport system substrate-binding protein
MKKMPITIALLVSFAAVCFVFVSNFRSTDVSPILADVSRIWWNPLPIVAADSGLYNKTNLNLRRFDVTSGRDSLEAVLLSKADFGMAAAAPIVNAGAKGRLEDLMVIARISSSDGLVAIISRKDPAAALEEPIGFVPNTMSHYLLIKSLQQKGMKSLVTLNTLPMPPADLVLQFNNESVNTFVAWEPYPTIAQEAAVRAGKQVPFIERIEGIHRMEFYLFTRKSFGKQHPNTVKKILESFELAYQEIKKMDRTELYKRLAKQSNVSEKSLQDLFARVDFRPLTDRSDLARLLAHEVNAAVDVKFIDRTFDAEALVKN